MSKGFKCDLCSSVMSSKFNLERHRGSRRCTSKAKACGLVQGEEVTIIRDGLISMPVTVQNHVTRMCDYTVLGSRTYGNVALQRQLPIACLYAKAINNQIQQP